MSERVEKVCDVFVASNCSPRGKRRFNPGRQTQMGKRKREAESQSAASHSSAAAASFAEGQLLKFGWKKGKGLGKDGHGIAKAIKVGHKQDTLGLGKDSDQWTVQVGFEKRGPIEAPF